MRRGHLSTGASILRRATIKLNVTDAMMAGEDRHHQVVMRLLAHEHGFHITSWTERFQDMPQAVIFEVDVEGSEMPTLPAYCSCRPHR